MCEKTLFHTVLWCSIPAVVLAHNETTSVVDANTFLVATVIGGVLLSFLFLMAFLMMYRAFTLRAQPVPYDVNKVSYSQPVQVIVVHPPNAEGMYMPPATANHLVHPSRSTRDFHQPPVYDQRTIVRQHSYYTEPTERLKRESSHSKHSRSSSKSTHRTQSRRPDNHLESPEITVHSREHNDGYWSSYE